MVNRMSDVPMYIQIAEILRDEIERHKDESIPIAPQKELVDRFDVSLITVRKALQVLEEEGRIVRKAGKGTFSVGKVYRDNLSELKTVSGIVSKGEGTTVRVLHMKRMRVDNMVKPEILEALGSECLYVLRLHENAGEPTTLSEIFIPVKYADLFTAERIEMTTTYEIFVKYGHLILGNGMQTIRANKANSLVAKHLNVMVGSPVLQIERCAYDASGIPFEYIKIYYEYSKFEMNINMKLKI
ncbi:GntR family transcriptional regulator [Fusibacter paucivorans]|uniref:GntR family transcriptional regulator n=1 Tax=Fusibacter paucivorans TaxID=76009 RepID=A0ABS5PRE4_9FIRM|nr:GntR family transcriptional regulator [Fusibacter paucivorans]MBS7527643.1 GntR family transcriptional regulator [Fusibacter paucivorans]